MIVKFAIWAALGFVCLVVGKKTLPDVADIFREYEFFSWLKSNWRGWKDGFLFKMQQAVIRFRKY